MVQLIKNPPALWETWVGSLGWEDPLEKGKATHSSSGLENSMDCMVQGVTKSQTRLSNFHYHFDYDHSDGCVVISTVVLICISLIISHIEHLWLSVCPLWRNVCSGLLPTF